MMLKVNDIYLDFNADIEIERKIKLFQNIDETDGDVSFAFEVDLTSKNISALGFPFPDSSSKGVYHVANTEVLDDNGLLINRGSIRIESITGRIASCSFLGGNSNWFARLNGNMTDLMLTKYDKELTEANIIASWDEDSGIVFPIIDTGALVTRGYYQLMIEDFLGCMFLHTLMFEIFQQSGLKIQGELIDDPFYKSLVVATNTRSMEQIDSRKSYVQKTSTQVAPPLPTPDVIIFDNDSISPYFDGSKNNFDLANSRYVADVPIAVSVTYNFTYDATGQLAFGIFINGIGIVFDGANGSAGAISKNYSFNLNAGDYLDVRFRETALSSGEITGGSITITPIFIYESYGSSSVPLWTKQQFVSNILSIFNTIVSYDEYTKTVTINYFDKIKEKQNIDISPYIQVDTVDYAEFISEFGKNNNFAYEEGDDEDLRKYNISSFVKYGSGVIPADNDFLEESADVIDSDFSAPISYVNIPFNSSFERIPFVELEEGDEIEITSTVDNAGAASFQITDADLYFTSDDLVRIETDLTEYNGDFRISSMTSTYIQVIGLPFGGDATGIVKKLTHKVTTDDSVYLFSVTKNIPTEDFSGENDFWIEFNIENSAMLAFFNVIRLGHTFEGTYKQGLSFDRTLSQFSFQRTLLEKYWTQFGRVINDPVMIKATGYLPWKVYKSIDFLQPITIRSLESSNQYYCNRISGYKNSFTPCEIELIKLP